MIAYTVTADQRPVAKLHWSHTAAGEEPSLGVHHEALRNWIRQNKTDRDECDNQPTTDMLGENRRLRRAVAELRRANEILKAASTYFAAELDPAQRRS